MNTGAPGPTILEVRGTFASGASEKQILTHTLSLSVGYMKMKLYS